MTPDALRLAGALLYGLFAGVVIAMMQFVGGVGFDWWIAVLAVGFAVVGYATWATLVESWGGQARGGRSPLGWRGASSETRNALLGLAAGLVLAVALAWSGDGADGGGWLKIAWLLFGFLVARAWRLWAPWSLPGVLSGAAIGVWLTLLAMLPVGGDGSAPIDWQRAGLTVLTVAATSALFGAAIGSVSDRWRELRMDRRV